MNQIGLNYLNQNRNIFNETIKEFNIGYCDQDLNFTTLNNVGFNIKSPKFKESIIIPIYDLYNNLLGIFSRRLNPINISKVDGSTWDKYHNLFNLNRSWKYIIEKNNVFIVEGPFDAIACYQFNHKNVVALMGTSISDYQICLLSRFTDTITFVLDNDYAGKQATLKGTELAKKYNLKVNNIVLQCDPDEEFKKNPNFILQ